MKKQQVEAVNCQNDQEMVKEGLRARPAKPVTRIHNTDSEKAMVRHMKALHKRGRLQPTTPMFLNKV